MSSSDIARLARVLLSLMIGSSLFVGFMNLLEMASNPALQESELMPFFEVVNTYLPIILFFAGIPAALLMVLFISKTILRAFDDIDSEKKSYEDEMSYYDESPQQLEQPRSGISLDDLVALRESDGELPDTAFHVS